MLRAVSDSHRFEVDGAVRVRCLQLALNDQGAGPDNWPLCPCGIFNDDDVVAPSSGHLIILLSEVGLGDVADGGQNPQAIEEAAVVIRLPQSAQLVTRWQGSSNLRGEEVGGENVLIGHYDGIRVC